ncbi:MAG: hypothetical protein WCD79_17905 [Chthoniobacteraceae bacterium]
MAESRIAQLATSPLLTQFAITASQRAMRPIVNFLSPLCEVPDLTFRYKTYDDKNRYRVPVTRRALGSHATIIGFTASDVQGQLNPNALDFPIPNAEQLSDEALQYSIMEGQSTLADIGALSLESEVVNTALTSLSGAATASQFSSNTIDPVAILDGIILNVMKAAKNGAPVKVLWGMSAFKLFRNNTNVRGRFVVGSGRNGGNVGLVSPGVDDSGSLLITNPETQLSQFVIDSSPQGTTSSLEFLLDNAVIVFASNSTPNRMDPSFMKTFARMGGFFKSSSYVTEDQRDEVLKMDWTTLVSVTNSAAAQMVTTS